MDSSKIGWCETSWLTVASKCSGGRERLSELGEGPGKERC